MKLFSFYLILVFVSWFDCTLAQPKVDPNGYNTFYHSNGNISSEGNLQEGKPNGYWKTYYSNGVLKSQGNRINFELDSIWKFYSDSGLIENEIRYKNNKKNGFSNGIYNSFH